MTSTEPPSEQPSPPRPTVGRLAAALAGGGWGAGALRPMPAVGAGVLFLGLLSARPGPAVRPGGPVGRPSR